jgi:hypothetical protein
MVQVSAAPGSTGPHTSTAPTDPGSFGNRSGLGGRPLEPLVQSRHGGRLVTSLSELAGMDTLPALHAARRAVSRLDPAEYAVSLDVREVAATAPLEICWTPVTAVIDLMLDWDLPELEISVTELATWLEVDTDVARRTVDQLGRYVGVVVERVADGAEVLVRLDIDTCPLTSARCSA